MGMVLVAGRNLVPRPAAGMTAVRTGLLMVGGIVHGAMSIAK